MKDKKISIRLPEDLNTALEKRLKTLSQKQPHMKWTRTDLILSILAEVLRREDAKTVVDILEMALAVAAKDDSTEEHG